MYFKFKIYIVIEHDEGNDEYEFLAAYSDENDLDNKYNEYLSSDTKPTTLAKTIDEVVKTNKKYLDDVLIKLKNDFEDKNQDVLLQENLFPNVFLDDLIELHQELDKEFQILTVRFAEFYNIFYRLRKKMLIYCYFMEQMEKVVRFVADLEAYHPNTK